VLRSVGRWVAGQEGWCACSGVTHRGSVSTLKPCLTSIAVSGDKAGWAPTVWVAKDAEWSDAHALAAGRSCLVRVVGEDIPYPCLPVS
jgi:hypothetical protein